MLKLDIRENLKSKPVMAYRILSGSYLQKCPFLGKVPTWQKFQNFENFNKVPDINFI